MPESEGLLPGTVVWATSFLTRYVLRANGRKTSDIGQARVPAEKRRARPQVTSKRPRIVGSYCVFAEGCSRLTAVHKVLKI